MERLTQDTLAALQEDIARPTYDRSAVTAGIAHIGVGGFHRAHQAMYVDRLLQRGQAREWGICGIGLLPTDAHMRDVMREQDGLYTLVLTHADGRRERRIIGSIVDYLFAPDDIEAVLERLASAEIRIVSLTVTEGGYNFSASTGEFDFANPAVVADLRDPTRPSTVFGIVTEALARRRDRGIPPFTVLSCDNVQGNGAIARRVFCAFASRRDAELGAWVERHVTFPDTMVDRITPVTSDADRVENDAAIGVHDAWPVVCEPFEQWVIRDDFVNDRPEWDRVGAQFVADVHPYELMKLRLLNGTHSSIAYLGQLLGRETVAEAFADPAIRRFVEALWQDFIVTLPAGVGLDTADYIARLAERYANTALRHRTAQIANDGSQKLPQRIVAATLERMERGLPIDRSAFVLAAWITALEARGTPPAFTDPLDGILAPIFAAAGPEKETVAAVFEAAGLAAGSGHRDGLVDATARALAAIRRDGAAAALSAL